VMIWNASGLRFTTTLGGSAMSAIELALSDRQLHSGVL
jgi:hypothetical protein